MLSHLFLSQHTVEIFSHLHRCRQLCTWTHATKCWMYIMKVKLKTPFLLQRRCYCGWTSELQELFIFLLLATLTALSFFSESLCWADQGPGSKFCWWHPSGTFLPLQISSSNSSFRKIFQVPIIPQCCFYAVKANVYPTEAWFGASSRKRKALTEHGRSYGVFPGPGAFLCFSFLGQ